MVVLEAPAKAVAVPGNFALPRDRRALGRTPPATEIGRDPERSISRGCTRFTGAKQSGPRVEPRILGGRCASCRRWERHALAAGGKNRSMPLRRRAVAVNAPIYEDSPQRTCTMSCDCFKLSLERLLSRAMDGLKPTAISTILVLKNIEKPIIERSARRQATCRSPHQLLVVTRNTAPQEEAAAADQSVSLTKGRRALSASPTSPGIVEFARAPLLRAACNPVPPGTRPLLDRRHRRSNDVQSK